MLGEAAIDHLAMDLKPLLVPGASQAFHARSLMTDPVTSATAMLVRFPGGWTRTPVSCSCAENVVILDGILEINGIGWGPGASFLIPENAVRWSARSSGALAIAWFSGRPIWSAVSEQASSKMPSGTPAVCSWSGDHPGGAVDLVDLELRTWMHFDPVAIGRVDIPNGEGADGKLIYRWPNSITFDREQLSQKSEN
jgi:hypothetical protein